MSTCSSGDCSFIWYFDKYQHWTFPKHTRELMSTTHTYPWLVTIIAWCRSFLSLSTNILLIKRKLKLESKAIAVDIAMSPRILGGKYRCCPHPRAHASFLWEAEHINWTASEAASSLDDRHNIVDHVVCFKAEFLLHTVISNEYGEFYTYGIYLYLNRSVCLLMGLPTWWRFSFCFQAGVPLCAVWWCDALLMRQFQMWGHWCKQWVSHWFHGCKICFCGILCPPLTWFSWD